MQFFRSKTKPPLYAFTHHVLESAENAAAKGDLTDTLGVLRGLSLDDFALLLLFMPDRSLPNISKRLPRMASEDVQQRWTGSSGTTLVRQSINFVRTLALAFRTYTDKRLEDAHVLDYGCGYGRILRPMLYFCDPEHLAGCDPWDVSLGLCRKDKVPGDLRQSDYLPDALPFGDTKFDLVYAFSVMTHTSMRATAASLRAIRGSIAPDGLLAVTIRPVEYWDFHQPLEDDQKADLTARHRDEGFAFLPHNRAPVDGDITYGDTSMTMDKLAALAEGWRIVGHDRSLDDALQIIVYLKPA